MACVSAVTPTILAIVPALVLHLPVGFLLRSYGAKHAADDADCSASRGAAAVVPAAASAPAAAAPAATSAATAKSAATATATADDAAASTTASAADDAPAAATASAAATELNFIDRPGRTVVEIELV